MAGLEELPSDRNIPSAERQRASPTPGEDETKFVADILRGSNAAALDRAQVLNCLRDRSLLRAPLWPDEARAFENGRWQANRMPERPFEFDSGWLGTARKKTVESLVRHGLLELVKVGSVVEAVSTAQGTRIAHKLYDMKKKPIVSFDDEEDEFGPFSPF
jgi:hypothetical protein